MAKKTWKLGEVAQGGVITFETRDNNNTVLVIGKEWDMSTGTRKSSDQSNAKEFTRLSVSLNESGSERLLTDFLEELTSSYWADQIMKYIKTKVTFKATHW
jgi:hypothetical protein